MVLPSRAHAAHGVLPLDIHVFSHHDRWFAFDVRNFAILKVTPLGGSVLALMAKNSRDEILDRLGEIAPHDEVDRWHSRLVGLVEKGVLSTHQEPLNTRPAFHRLVLMVAGGCNMGCSYCFERHVDVFDDACTMSRETADEVLEWFFRYHEGPRAHIQLYGGEPLLNWDVVVHSVERAEAWARAEDIALTKYIITNGTLLSPERISYLSAHEVAVQVSADGDAATHDRFRTFKSGQPTMHLIQPNIHELSRQGLRFNLRAVVTRQNRSPQQVVQGLKGLGGRRVSFEVVATELDEARFTPEDWGAFNEDYRQFLPQEFCGWGDLPEEMQSMIIRICERRRLAYGCGAGVSEVTVAPDGSIYECQRLFREPLGHVREGKGPRELNRAFLTPVDERPICQTCWARYLCGGGCLHQAQTEQGSDAPFPPFCEMKRSLAEASIAMIQDIRSRARRGPLPGELRCMPAD